MPLSRSLFLSMALVLVVRQAIAGPSEDANAAVTRWSAAYSSNDVEQVVGNYWPDAVLLGTVSPVMSVGTDAIRTYFTPLAGSGNRNELGERRTIVLDDHAAMVTGFYAFTRMVNGTPQPGPSRFTMLVTERNGEWRIMHHHSSPRTKPQ